MNDGAMNTLPQLTGDHAIQALNHPNLIPPRRGDQFLDGRTAALRDAMARFSSGPNHAARREVLLELLSTIDPNQAERLAAEITTALHGDRGVGADWLSWHVPTYVVASLLGLEDQRELIRCHTETIAKVIGRNEPSSAKSDQAAEELLSLCQKQIDPVAAVSVLYQNHDATAGLIGSMADTSRPAPAGATVREAAVATAIGDMEIVAGQQISIDLTDMTYGTGAHACPGQELALAIADGVVSAISSGQEPLASDQEQ